VIIKVVYFCTFHINKNVLLDVVLFKFVKYRKKKYLNVIHQGRCCVNTLTVAPSQELSKRMEPKVHIIIMTRYKTT
jgi:hypothetical protein